ncbi:hypothetical protein EJ02DRAFT_314884, partial [Clathrospora elynae]
PTRTATRPHATTTVTVGKAGRLVFSPSSLNASIGSVVAFDFLSLNHTLSQSSLSDPCHIDGGFDTGFRQFNPANVSGKFVIEVKIIDKEPKWFFCAQTIKRSHCQASMVFSLNPCGAHNQFLQNALIAIDVPPSPTDGACQLPAVDLIPSNPSNTSTHVS